MNTFAAEPLVLRRWHAFIIGAALAWSIFGSSVSAMTGLSSANAVRNEQIAELQKQLVSVEAKMDAEQADITTMKEQLAAQTALLQDMKARR